MVIESEAVLVSGGIDSSVLLAERQKGGRAVHPIFVRAGHHWEDAELAHLERFLNALECPTIQPLVVLQVPMGDLLPGHWSMTGRGVPDGDTPDEAVYLPARNVLLLSKAMLWCHLAGVSQLSMGTLRGNPFPDATRDFIAGFSEVVNRGLGAPSSVTVRLPFAELGKLEVLRRGSSLPLELTISCMRPQSGRHCGDCNKCAERRRGFIEAGLPDRTAYAVNRPDVA